MGSVGVEDAAALADPMQAILSAERTKYAEEREKRLRADGNDQFRAVEGELVDFATDLFVERTAREAQTGRKVDTMIIGAGFGGMAAAIELSKKGQDDFLIVEKAGDVGGTWYWNRYPGVKCDVESTIYLPFLEEVDFKPTWKYSTGEEIFAFSQKLAQKYSLYERALFQTEVVRAQWDDNKHQWLAQTDRGDIIEAKFLVTAPGFMHKPKLPGIPGLSSFKGKSFHTSRWDYTYTGGSQTSKMTGLEGKVVGIIGTGATGVQAVAPLAEAAKHLYVFQRTPSTISPRNNVPLDEAWWKTLPKGWHKKRVENFGLIAGGVPQTEDLVKDGWTYLFSPSPELVHAADASAPKKSPTPEAMMAAAALDDHFKMDKIRQRVDDIVKNEETARKLKPWYSVWCKRPGFHDEYLDTFNRDNVTLVDTNGRGVDRIEADGLVANGERFRLDCLVLATGFEFASDLQSRMGTTITGRDGLDLMSYWSQGPRTLHGLLTRHFPNMLYLSNHQAGVGPNYTELLCNQAQHLAYIIDAALRRGAATVEVTAEAEDAWVDLIVNHPMSQGRVQYLASCTPGYFNSEGHLSGADQKAFSYPTGAPAFFQATREWRDKGTFEGLTFGGAEVAAITET